MKLSHDMIRSICLGAVRTKETETGVRLYRFTEEQEELYRQEKEAYYYKCFATAGMKLCFETDSRSLFLKVDVTAASSRKYFSIDVTSNGKLIGYLDNFSHMEVPQAHASLQGDYGEFSKNFELGEGTKNVCIYLPWSMAAEIRELSLDDNAFVKPVKPSKKLLIFGDSITQGQDALRPSSRYACRLAEALGAEEINKGISGERFFPALGKTREDFEPDYITVAYGTNDWTHLGEEEFRSKCYAFYEALRKTYPTVKIFAITPIWRGDCMSKKKFGPFHKVAEGIEELTAEFDNITCIHGFELVPHEEQCFADLRLHPNDKGYDHYFRNLSEQIFKYI